MTRSAAQASRSALPAIAWFGRLMVLSLAGSLAVAGGLAIAYLTIATPFVSVLVPRASDGGMSVGITLGVWSFSLIAAGGLLVAGANRLALTVALLKGGGSTAGPAMRALRGASAEVTVITNVVPREGPPVPELLIGPFGAAVIHEHPPTNSARHGPSGWEARPGAGWEPIDGPLETATRDAERVRRWFAGADLDFVVRVYAAVVASDRVMPRSSTCAVIDATQIPVWVASLPRQRTLTPGRRGRLVALARTGQAAQ